MSLHAIMAALLGRLLGLGQTQAVDGCQAGFAASWARQSPVWLLFGCLILAAAAAVFYLRYQESRRRRPRIVLAVFRAVVLCLLLLMLAEPILSVNITSRKRPTLWLLVDGTDSMGICDEVPTAQRAALSEATGLAPADSSAESSPPSRIDYVKALMAKDGGSLLGQLGEKFRIEAFLFDSPQGVRSLELSEGGVRVDGRHLARQLTTRGKVTAIGAALADLGRRYATANLAGVVVVSDFGQNSGPPAVEAARRLGVPVYTVGVGATTAVDVAVEVQAPVYVQKDERSTVEVTLRQEGLDGQTVHVHLDAEPLGGLKGTPGSRVAIGEKDVQLTAPIQTVEFPYVPDKAGRFDLVAEVDPVPGEVIRENNRATRDITVLDDFLRLLYVEYEPTWEWRFIKEVFHRDKLVGVKGFRTFLHSSDPRVRRANELFLSSMAGSRADFFAHDVIFLGDMPSSALSPRFCSMTKEFVRDFGGGLVVLAGPRFGIGQLADTPLGELLPVSVEAGAGPDDRQPFTLQLTPMAAAYEFMQLGASPQETERAWAGLGPLPWYQPVRRVHPQAVVLAEHPRSTCVDGKQKQPLIAQRPFGRGEVIYLGFDETWRMRRLYGERYYRQFWGQMIQRLALNHALGSQKRFVVRTDRRHYQVDEPVIVNVEAYNANFEPLADSDVPNHKLQGELWVPAEADSRRQGVQPLSLPQTKKGVFETRLTVFTPGEHRIRVTDPISGNPVEWTFQVTGTPVERQRAVRNVALQTAMAAETGGRTFDLKNVGDLLGEVQPAARTEMSVEVIPLASTWLSFLLVVGLLLSEWLVRKLENMR
ncbi:MAG: hypothetical protein ABR915_14130 [Thermoguttaceae bacterium]